MAGASFWHRPPVASQSPAFVERMTAALWKRIRRSSLPLPVRGRFALENFAEALRVTIAGRPGKIVFSPGLNA
jgi:hypothetical protein